MLARSKWQCIDYFNEIDDLRETIPNRAVKKAEYTSKYIINIVACPSII